MVKKGYKSEKRKILSLRHNCLRRKCKSKYDSKTISRLMKANPKKYPINIEDNYYKQKQVWIRKNRKLSSDNKKQVKKCRKTCDEKYNKSIKKLNKDFKEDYKEEKKILKQDCCKCHYVRTKSGRLRKIRGPWGHYSYDMSNCCKDKKTIRNK